MKKEKNMSIEIPSIFHFQVLPCCNANSVPDIQLDLLAELWITVSLDSKGWRFVTVTLVIDDTFDWT